MVLFENCSVLLELKNLPFKEKKKLQSAVTENGGRLSYVVNKECSLVVTSGVAALSSSRLRSVWNLGTPVVGVDYVSRCLEQGILLPPEEYKLEVPPPQHPPHLFSSPWRLFSQQDAPPPNIVTGRRNTSYLSVSERLASEASSEVKVTETRPLAGQSEDPPPSLKPVHQTEEGGTREGDGSLLGKFRIYTEKNDHLPSYPQDFQVAKYSIFKKVTGSTWSVVELQSVRAGGEQRYRVVQSSTGGMGAQTGPVSQKIVFPATAEEALEVYQALQEELRAQGFKLQPHLSTEAPDLGSAALKQLLMEEKLNTGSVPPEVAVFVELLWREALGCLDNVLSVPVSSLSLNDVSRAEGYLLQAQKELKESRHHEASSLLSEVYNLLPHRETLLSTPSAKILSQKLDLCQLIRDMLNVSEIASRRTVPFCVGKYRSLRCSVDPVPAGTEEARRVMAMMSDRKVTVLQVMRVNRWEEQQMFRKEVGNIKLLLHSTAPSNFVGILSRGLLLPHVGVEHHGIQRTDGGNLGSGIYFSDSIRTSLKYSKLCERGGARLLLACDVALGRCRRLLKRTPDLRQPPDQHHSVHGVRRTPSTHSEFEDDEFVVYSPDQVMVRYVVHFCLEDDPLQDFCPSIDTTVQLPQPYSSQELPLEMMKLSNKKNPLDDVTAGLLDSSGHQLPLQAVHVKCKLMDLLCQVVIFQKYTNHSSVPIEAKYVFPLDDCAAVCGFEAFINGKHIVGQVKEKEKARREYKQAIQRGHGAYLMDQDAPDVFTISVGNLPPGAAVLIKVTFVSELIVRDGCIVFSLPGHVAPWQQSEALNQTTQTSVEKSCVTNEAACSRDFSLDMGIEMPYEIQRLHCTTHRVKIKKTDCKAVLSVLPGEVLGAAGFQLSITLSDLHLPRMWVERHPSKESQACMLVFYPDFEVGPAPGPGPGPGPEEVVVLLDASESMVGQQLMDSRRLALALLSALPLSTKVNVIFFGTDHTELFFSAQPLSHALQSARKFILSQPATGGSTELWRPLRALSLLPPSCGSRNLVLLSDGHVQNAGLALRLLRENAARTRLFTCGVSSTANQHMLRTLTQAGGGAYEYFDSKTEHNWIEKVAAQVKRMASPGCSSVSVKWQQFDRTAPPPVQAPKQLHALFNDCHTLVYGFVPHCTQASLHGNLGGKELVTMVSTSELQKTRGTFLHKLAARAVISDYENGILDISQAEHEGLKAQLKSSIVELSKEFSILSQFTSFVAIEERDPEHPEEPQATDIPKLITEEDVDFLPYVDWEKQEEEEHSDEEGSMEEVCDLLEEMMSSDFLPFDGWKEMEEEEHSDEEVVEATECPQAAHQPAEIPPLRTGAAGLLRSLPSSFNRVLIRYGHEYSSTRVLDINSRVTRTEVENQPLSGSCIQESRVVEAVAGSGAAGESSSEAELEGVECPEPIRKVSTSGQIQSKDLECVHDGPPPPPSAGFPVMRGAAPPPPPSAGFPVMRGAAPPPPEPSSRFLRRRFPRHFNATVDSLPATSPLGRIAAPDGVLDAPVEESVTARVPEVAFQKKFVRRVCYPSIARDETGQQEVQTHPEASEAKWINIFQMQCTEGYWECTAELGWLLKLDLHSFANVYLKNKGICSLGVRARADILRLLASLLVLQLLRLEGLEEGKLLPTLFSLDVPSEPRCERWQAVKRAVAWVRWADYQYPCICTRLEFGCSWESATRQLLGYDQRPTDFPPQWGHPPWRGARPLPGGLVPKKRKGAAM